MKKTILIITLALFAVCVTNAQDTIRSITAGDWTKTLKKDVTYTLEPFGSNIVIKEGTTNLHSLVLPGTLVFSSEESVMINGIRWATRNVGAHGQFVANPEDFGMFYQWGSNVGWSSTDPLTATDGINTWRDLSEKGDTWLPAKNPCPDGWRVPTYTELLSLETVTKEWNNLNGVNGYFIGDGEPKLFLPAAGYRNSISGSLRNVGTYGGYWISTPYSTNAYYLGFVGDLLGMSYLYRAFGFSVRCVAE